LSLALELIPPGYFEFFIIDQKDMGSSMFGSPFHSQE
jgi:hypothetical protein